MTFVTKNVTYNNVFSDLDSDLSVWCLFTDAHWKINLPYPCDQSPCQRKGQKIIIMDHQDLSTESKLMLNLLPNS